jgi:hypothetical protein
VDISLKIDSIKEFSSGLLADRKFGTKLTAIRGYVAAAPGNRFEKIPKNRNYSDNE